MCAIHGFIDDSINNSSCINTILKMIESTNYRGPDFSDYIAINSTYLGHNRLSIIDLNPISNQPMVIDDFTIVFNGEIYNFIEIRNKLIEKNYIFRTESDTEVIINAYREWGEQCVNHFLGMWAFAIWDTKKNQLFCSRDRFGIKPFYFIKNGRKFYFSSEVKALKNSSIFSNNLNITQISRALQLGWMFFKDETMYESVNSLEPGHSIIYKDGEINISQYWKIEKNRYHFKNEYEYVEEFKLLFNETLNLHLRSDVPIGATLSGGIDSSSIVCSILKNKSINNLKTYSIYYEGKDTVDERPFIEEIRKMYPDQFESFYYSPKLNEIESEFHNITHHCDFPLLSSSPISQYFIMKAISNDNIKVVLSGQGADDYLGGYMHSFYRLYADQMSSFQWGKFISNINIHKKLQQSSLKDTILIGGKSILSSFLNENKLYEFEYKNYYPFITNLNKNKTFNFEKTVGMNKFENFHHSLINYSSLPTLLHYEDRNSMASSIESRVPFLDHRLVDLAFSTSNELKINKGITKWILRESMKDVLPSKIKNRTDKKGFVTPGEILWLRNSMKHLLDIDYSKLDFLNKSLCQKEINNFKNGNNSNSILIWRLANLNYWIKNFN
jgi:asparagine synthase (glutamine-hydrolysing)